MEWFRHNLRAVRKYDTNGDDEVGAAELLRKLVSDGIVCEEFLTSTEKCMINNAAKHINESLYWFKSILPVRCHCHLPRPAHRGQPPPSCSVAVTLRTRGSMRSFVAPRAAYRCCVHAESRVP